MNNNCEHLVTLIPNNFVTRWLVKCINKRMKKAESKYRLHIRYRRPKKGLHYGYGGGLRCSNAKTFSLYLRERNYRRIWK